MLREKSYLRISVHYLISANFLYISSAKCIFFRVCVYKPGVFKLVQKGVQILTLTDRIACRVFISKDN